MKEFLELRVKPELVFKLNLEKQARDIGGIYVVTLDYADPKIVEIKQFQHLYFGWDLFRKYSKSDLAGAQWFNFFTPRRFEPCGEECGVVYDEEKACKLCGAGAVPTGIFKLNLNKVPKNVDIAETIASEIIVSEKMASLLTKYEIKGVGFDKIQHVGRGQRENWYLLKILSRPVEITDKTKVGNDPIDTDFNKYRCPNNDNLGIACLSELYLSSEGYDGSDFLVTRQYFGVRMGLLRPNRFMVVSSKVESLLKNNGIKGYKTEIAHLGFRR